MDFKLTDLIYHLPGFLPKNDCLTLIDFYERNSNKSSYEHSYNFETGTNKYSLFKSIDITEDTKEYSIVFSATEKVVNLYCKYLNDQKLFFPTFKNHYAYSHKQRLLKYEKGAYLHMHTDLAIVTQGSITFNLNDDYEGGDFSFFNGNYKVKLGCGDALIFPAGLHWIHGVDKITSGVRYSTNSFLQPTPAWVEKDIIQRASQLMNSSNLHNDNKHRYKIVD